MTAETIEVRRDLSRMLAVVDGDGPGYLHLHGLLGFGHIARGEAPAGYRVATYDQRGHGRGTPFTDPVAYAIDEFVADAVAVLDALGWRRVAVGGTSMGAAVATRLALDHPQRVSRLALIGPAFGDKVNGAVDVLEGMATGMDALGIDGVTPLIRAAQTGRGIPPEATAYLDAWPAHDATALATALRQVGHWVPFPNLDELRAISVPAYVVGWPDDPMHPLRLAERMAAVMGARLGRVSGVAEVLRGPAAVRAALTTVMEGRTGAAMSRES